MNVLYGINVKSASKGRYRIVGYKFLDFRTGFIKDLTLDDMLNSSENEYFTRINGYLLGKYFRINANYSCYVIEDYGSLRRLRLDIDTGYQEGVYDKPTVFVDDNIKLFEDNNCLDSDLDYYAIDMHLIYIYKHKESKVYKYSYNLYSRFMFNVKDKKDILDKNSILDKLVDLRNSILYKLYSKLFNIVNNTCIAIQNTYILKGNIDTLLVPKGCNYVIFDNLESKEIILPHNVEAMYSTRHSVKFSKLYISKQMNLGCLLDFLVIYILEENLSIDTINSNDQLKYVNLYKDSIFIKDGTVYLDNYKYIAKISWRDFEYTGLIHYSSNPCLGLIKHIVNNCNSVNSIIDFLAYELGLSFAFNIEVY